MLSKVFPFAIALDQVSEADTAADNIYEELEQVSNALAPDPSFEYIHLAHREFAEDTSREFNRFRLEQILYELAQGRRVLDAKERLTKPSEFRQWKQSLNATAADIRKWVKLVLTFGKFPIEKIISIASAVNIYTLCTQQFSLLVEKLKELPVLASDQIKQMVKEARPPRKPKQQQPKSTVELARDVSGGGRHLNFQLYDDELIAKINSQSEKEQITRQQAVSIAFKRSEKLDIVQQQYTSAIAEVREKQIQMQRDLIDKDECINDLTQQLVERDNQIQELRNLVTSSTTVTAPEQSLLVFNPVQTWEDVAQSFGCDRALFLDTMKTWTVEQKELLPGLLAEHIEEHGPECLDELKWIPDKLRECDSFWRNSLSERIPGSNSVTLMGWSSHFNPLLDDNLIAMWVKVSILERLNLTPKAHRLKHTESGE